MSLLLSAVTLSPALVPPQATGPTEGYIAAQPLPDAVTSCKPAHICASTKVNLHGCYFNNFYNGSVGGTPLTIDVTQTGPNTLTYVYWVNTYYQSIGIKGKAMAKYRCP